MCEQYNVIVEQENVTVMSSYTPLPREERGGQSEEELELSFIKQLTEQGYEYVNITSEAQMISNLRKEIDRQNAKCLIQIDGGATKANASAIFAAGADILVAGSAVFKDVDSAGAIRALRQA